MGSQQRSVNHVLGMGLRDSGYPIKKREHGNMAFPQIWFQMVTSLLEMRFRLKWLHIREQARGRCILNFGLISNKTFTKFIVFMGNVDKIVML